MDGFPLSLQKVDEVCHIFVLLGFRIKIKEAHHSDANRSHLVIKSEDHILGVVIIMRV